MITAQRRATDIIQMYRKTFYLLQGYDEGFQKEAVQIDQQGTWPIDEAREELAKLRESLKACGEATDLFAREREDAFVSLWGNLESSVFGADAYPSVEVRAAHVLYFVVKNHPFSDGNKRSGAYLFLSYLSRQMGPVAFKVVNPEGLAALTVLVAESKPDGKDLLIDLITHMISRGEHNESRGYQHCNT